MSTQRLTSADCRGCGACCVGASEEVLYDGYADLMPKDAERMSPAVRQTLVSRVIGGDLRLSTAAKELPSGDFACRHLRGTPGKRCSCSIYDTRPDVCRKFTVNSWCCREARSSFQSAHFGENT